ncbi:MAG TPA: aminodeoxychorismate/anthranilate synthase component II [Gemmatimonadales bacterium]
MKIFVLDNYDSFTYNLVQYLGELGAEPVVQRNDQISVEDIAEMAPDGIVISPGPGVPGDAGISIALVKRVSGHIPLLGVCLGHQAIGEAFGGTVVRAERLMHGKTSPVNHTGEGIFANLPRPMTAMRYHSLLLDPATLPDVLEMTAWTDDRPKGDEIMGVRHRTHPVFGVQFHPESVGTEVGKDLMRNYLKEVTIRKTGS